MLMSAHDGGVNHHVLVVVIAGQEPENPLENATLGPSVEALIDDLPVAKALGQIAPGDAGAKSEQKGFVRVRDREAGADDPARIRFTPAILPLYARRSKSPIH